MSDTNITDRKATAMDVAKLAGVSKYTVSRAFTPKASISEKSREKVLKAAQDLGYKPNLLARGLSKNKSNIIGIVVDNFENPHKLMQLNEVTSQLQSNGKTAMMLNISNANCSASVLNQADQFQVDALLFLGAYITEDLLQLALTIKHIPFVVVGRSSDISDIDFISTDDSAAGNHIGALLLAQNHRRFGFMSGPESSSTWLARLEGYREALLAQKLDVEAVLKAGKYDRQRGFAVMDSYLQTAGDDHFDAIFCENDILAIGCLDAIKKHQKKIAVVGFDNIELANAESYLLTTYQQPLRLMVQQALHSIEYPKAANSKQLNGKLVLRSSHLK